MRTSRELYPDYTAEIEALDEGGLTVELLQRIIFKHRHNSKYNKKLDDRYKVVKEGLPILNRKSRFDDNPINNQINNDFFGEIIDFKAGYFAGSAFSYSYSDTEESEQDTGSDAAVELAKKTLSDFVTLNNMYDKDLEMTKQAAINGYCGRLFYHDEDGNERVMITPSYQTIILSKTTICEPEYAVRYFMTTDINDNKIWKVEFYDRENIHYYKGNLSNLEFVKKEPNLYDFCPLQGIPNNNELIGDAEKVLQAIDDYDRNISDNSNDIESFSSAYMVFENVIVDDKEMEKAQASGAIQFKTGPNGGKIYYLTKEINDTFTENHLNRLQKDIYKFSKTPDLSDASFGTASGISLKFKLLGLETKCGMFEAKVDCAAVYMFKLLASAWIKKKVKIDPLQCYIEYKRNFPLDIVGEADAAQKLINTGMPKQYAWEQALSFVNGDDIDYIMQLIEQEQENIAPLNGGDKSDEITELSDKNMYKVTSILGQLKRGQITNAVAIRLMTGLGFSEEYANEIVQENITGASGSTVEAQSDESNVVKKKTKKVSQN